jgi:hypothetical protein
MNLFTNGLALRRAAATLVLVATAGVSPVFACPVCFGADESPLIDGARIGVAVLLAVTLVVQGAFLSFFIYLRRRAKQVAESDLENEWSKLQRTRTS